MKPFKIPDWRRTHIRDKYRRKDFVISKFTLEMERVLRKAVDEIIDFGLDTGKFKKPEMADLDPIMLNFYRNVIEQGLHAAKYEKQAQKGKKRLAKLPTGLPEKLYDLGQVFHNRKYFEKIMKRAKALTRRLRKDYLQKLEKQFKAVMPKLTSGEYSPAEAKKVMVGVWAASKSRVEVIFRTETTKYFTDTQVNFFKDDEDIIGFLFDSVRDTSRTEICRSRHGLVYRPNTNLLRDNMPPCHPNCRSHLIALANTEENRKLIQEPDRIPSRVKVVPLPPDWLRWNH